MGVTYGGEPCIDPLSLRAEYLAQSPPLPLEPWWNRANHFRCPLGSEPGRGVILLRKASLDKLDLNAVHTLTFQDDQKRVFPFQQVSIVRAHATNPSHSKDPNMVYWCEVADQRHISQMYTIARSYNVRSYPGSASYVATSLNNGALWTWDEMVQDLWSEVDPNPIALPFVPDGDPEGFIFDEWKAWDALTHVMQRLACAVRYNPALGTYTIVRLGEEDAAAAQILRNIRDRLIWDEYPVEPARTRTPEKVRVVFARQPATLGGDNYYSIEVEDTDPDDGVLSGTRVLVFDDLPALITNPSDCATRAAERAADYYRVHKHYTRRHNQIYAGVVQEIIQVVFTQYHEFSIEDRGAGYKTSLYAGPLSNGKSLEEWLESWRPTYDPSKYICCAGDTIPGGGGETGCGCTAVGTVLTFCDKSGWFENFPDSITLTADGDGSYSGSGTTGTMTTISAYFEPEFTTMCQFNFTGITIEQLDNVIPYFTLDNSSVLVNTWIGDRACQDEVFYLEGLVTISQTVDGVTYTGSARWYLTTTAVDCPANSTGGTGCPTDTTLRISWVDESIEAPCELIGDEITSNGYYWQSTGIWYLASGGNACINRITLACYNGSWTCNLWLAGTSTEIDGIVTVVSTNPLELHIVPDGLVLCCTSGYFVVTQ